MIRFDFYTGKLLNPRIIVRERPKTMYSKSKYRRSLLTNWRNRLFLDSSVVPCVFLTLTIDPEHYTLDKEEQKKMLQRFFKRLRRALDYHNGDELTFFDKRGRKQIFTPYVRKIKYFVTKECGEKLGRSHFHCLLFGIPYSIAFGEFLESQWQNGITYLLPCSSRRINYTTKYMLKKYEDDNFFSLKSNGIGDFYAFQNLDQLGYCHRRKSPVIHVQGREIWLPRYIKNKFFDELDRESFNNTLVEGMLKKMCGSPDTWMHFGGGLCAKIPHSFALEIDRLNSDDILLTNLNKR